MLVNFVREMLNYPKTSFLNWFLEETFWSTSFEGMVCVRLPPLITLPILMNILSGE